MPAVESVGRVQPEAHPVDPIVTQLLVHGGPTAVVAVAGVVLVVALQRLEHARQEKLLGHLGEVARAVRAMARATRRQAQRVDHLAEQVRDGCAARQFLHQPTQRGEHT